MGKVGLSDIVTMPAFEGAASLFHQATGMTLSFYDEAGQVVFYPAEKRCEFCHLIQSTQEGRRRCHESDQAAALSKDNRPRSYTCHAGLIDVVVPVVVAGKRVGCFYSGQSLLKPPTAMSYHDMRALVADLEINSNRLWEAYRLVPAVDESRLEMAMGLLSIICGHLVERETALQNERALTLEQRKLRKAAEERARLERYLREMELRLLQAQLNPHFLFNALNLLLGESIAENASRTSEMVENLSLLLRNSVGQIGNTVSLTDEMTSTRAYVDIFAARFDKRIDMQTELDPQVSDFAIPALTLQPLVENALIHALPKCQGRFILRVSASRVDDAVEITVVDNGPGLSPEALAFARAALENRDPECKLTGLVGVNRRLKYYYESIQDLELDFSGGFSVKIRIPASGEIRNECSCRIRELDSHLLDFLVGQQPD